MPSLPESTPISYRPSAFYFRKSLRETSEAEALRAIGMTLCSELEDLKAWVREQGLIPPRFHATDAEAVDKKWVEGDHAAEAPPEARPELG